MAIVIDSGRVTAETALNDVPRAQWAFLMRERRDFLHSNLSHDCRCLVQFVDEAKLMFSELGFATVADMIRNGYELEPEEIDVALDWLRLNPPDEPISLETAKLNAHGANQYGPCDHKVLPRYGTAAHWIARLERDAITYPQAASLLAQVHAKQITANAAAVIMGWRKPPPPPLTVAMRAWDKLTAQEREKFLNYAATDGRMFNIVPGKNIYGII